MQARRAGTNLLIPVVMFLLARGASAQAPSGVLDQPYDGQVVTDSGAPLGFDGFDTVPHALARVYAWDGSGWDLMGTAPADVECFLCPRLWGWDLGGRVLTPSHWFPGRSGSYARVRAEAGHLSANDWVVERELASMDWSRLVDPLPPCNADTFVRAWLPAFRSEHSPEAFVYTQDFRCSMYGDAAAGLTECCDQEASRTRLAGGACLGRPAAHRGAGQAAISETSIAVVAAWDDKRGRHPSHVVVGYNDAQPRSGTPGDLFGWAFSTDAAASWPASNIRHAVAPVVGSGPPLARGAPLSGTPLDQVRFMGDPAVVATGQPGVVAYASMAASAAAAPSDADMLVVAVSTDGGETFATTTQVNDRIGQSWTTDEPDVAVDESDPAGPSIWITWRAYGASAVADAYTYVRGGRIDPRTGAVSWIDNGHDVPTTRALQQVGPPRIAADSSDGTQRILLAYPEHTTVPGCPSGPVGQKYVVDVSTDGGASWPLRRWFSGPNTREIPLCALDPPGGSQVNVSSRIGFVFDRQARALLVALAESATFGAGTTRNGSVIRVLRRTLSELESGDGAWTLVHSAVSPAGGRWQFMPELAVDGNGHVALAYYESDAATNGLVSTWAAGSPDHGLTWRAPLQLSPGFTMAAMRSIGDYLSITAVPLAARAPANSVTLAGTSRGLPADFYVASGDGGGNVITYGYGVP